VAASIPWLVVTSLLRWFPWSHCLFLSVSDVPLLPLLRRQVVAFRAQASSLVPLNPFSWLSSDIFLEGQPAQTGPHSRSFCGFHIRICCPEKPRPFLHWPLNLTLQVPLPWGPRNLCSPVCRAQGSCCQAGRQIPGEENLEGWALVAHACNPSHSGGRDLED
jgi:hypothetical protein